MIPDKLQVWETLPLPATETFDPSILIFAALAVFVVWKLWSVLGIRADRENPAGDRFRGAVAGGRVDAAPAPAARLAPAARAVSPDRWKGFAEPGGKVWAGLDAVAAVDPEFDVSSFIDGAEKAYRLIVESFAKGDRDTLHNLLAKEVFESFARELGERERRGETAEAHVAAIEKALVEDAQVQARNAMVTVRFVVLLVSVRRNRAGETIDGHPTEPIEIVDLWTFQRDVASRDPNWKLVATETVH